MHNRFSEKWLETTCAMLPNVDCAVFVVPDASNEQLHLLAHWPRERDQHAELLDTVKYALKKRDEVCIANAQVIDGQQMDLFAKPIYLRDELVGVLAIRLHNLPPAKHTAVFESLRRSVRWLGLASFTKPQSDDFYGTVVGMLASCFDACLV